MHIPRNRIGRCGIDWKKRFNAMAYATLPETGGRPWHPKHTGRSPTSLVIRRSEEDGTTAGATIIPALIALMPQTRSGGRRNAEMRENLRGLPRCCVIWIIQGEYAYRSPAAGRTARFVDPFYHQEARASQFGMRGSAEGGTRLGGVITLRGSPRNRGCGPLAGRQIVDGGACRARRRTARVRCAAAQWIV